MGYLTNPLKLLGFQTPPHLTPMIVPKPTINASPSCAVKFCLSNGISPQIKRLAEIHTTNHAALATLAQWRDRRVRGAKPASAVALQTAPRVAACFFGDALSHRVHEPSHGGGWVTLQCRCGLAASALRLSHNQRCRRTKRISARKTAFMCCVPRQRRHLLLARNIELFLQACKLNARFTVRRSSTSGCT